MATRFSSNPLVRRVFALIELLRGAAAFMAAPILLHLAETVARSPASGVPVALWDAPPLAARIRDDDTMPRRFARQEV